MKKQDLDIHYKMFETLEKIIFSDSNDFSFSEIIQNE